eukprot:TRINITY_DN69486_c0_g1_i1.p1 TRINITY_DN69486_c0_g1~~TRINITY_DN69486_c0_g1_i1.p1  ORF type:complete len:236 (-),score=46.09 TRINITY_DN69486_c0_g1_i1:285-935(-)
MYVKLLGKYTNMQPLTMLDQMLKRNLLNVLIECMFPSTSNIISKTSQLSKNCTGSIGYVADLIIDSVQVLDYEDTVEMLTGLLGEIDDDIRYNMVAVLNREQRSLCNEGAAFTVKEGDTVAYAKRGWTHLSYGEIVCFFQGNSANSKIYAAIKPYELEWCDSVRTKYIEHVLDAIEYVDCSEICRKVALSEENHLITEVFLISNNSLNEVCFVSHT